MEKTASIIAIVLILAFSSALAYGTYNLYLSSWLSSPPSSTLNPSPTVSPTITPALTCSHSSFGVTDGAEKICTSSKCLFKESITSNKTLCK